MIIRYRKTKKRYYFWAQQEREGDVDLSEHLALSPVNGLYTFRMLKKEGKRFLKYVRDQQWPERLLKIQRVHKPREEVYEGDCLATMRTFANESVDCIATDPPYGLNFMQHDWDKALPSIKIWKECLRILKHGAFAFVLCTPRQDCLARMIIRLQDAGFVVGFTSLYWIYAEGFTKASNISKKIDARAGAEREVVGVSSAPNKKGGKGYTGKRYTEKRKTKFGDVQDQPEKSLPATEEAQKLDGAFGGFQPKPALEPIIVVMKPLSEKTYIDQALANGKGVTWLDDGRIPIAGAEDAKEVGQKNQHQKFGSGPRTHNVYGDITNADRDDYDTSKGRFPANVLVGGDALNDGSKSESRKGKPRKGRPGKGWGMTHTGSEYDDTGSPSRYFDLDAWFADRIGDLPEEVQRIFPNLLVSKASPREKNAGLKGLTKKAKPLMGEFKNNPGRKTPKSSPVPRENHHPTVKPVSLMAYLTILGSRPGDLVLDPFSGSGTTGVACALLDRHFVGCELDEEFIEIAERRIAHAQEVRRDFLRVDIKKAMMSLGSKKPTGMRRLKKS